MEELRQTALACYRKLSDEEKKLATGMFHAMDANGNGSISYDEYNNFLEEVGGNCISNRSIFQALDRDGDGSLDYEEFLTIHYMFITGRIIFCDVCKAFLCGAYFSCVQCFWGSSKHTFDLCRDCYRNKSSYDHHNDAVFLDNYAMLLFTLREHKEQQQANSSPAVTSSSQSRGGSGNFERRLAKGVERANTVLTVIDGVNTVSSFCSIQ